jgi:CubicO group peptidase (beta-lactamase class C family)
VPHVAAIAANRDGVIYQGAAGPRAVGENDPVTVDTLFRIMSMTKMPCTVAALQQVEEGNLDLDARVADYCPEFAEIQVLTGFDGDTPMLRPPARQATVKNLVTHTSGLGVLVLERGPGQMGERDRNPECGGRIGRLPHGAHGGRPR